MADLSPLHVLVIDDDSDTRLNLQDILELDGYRVETAGSVAETFRRDNWSQFAAIILDRKLPDGTAEEVLPRLKALAPEAAVIIVTGYADLENVIAAIRQGAVDYILKPVNPELIRSRLAGIAARKRAAEEIVRLNKDLLQAERLAAIGQMITGLTHESGNALARSQSCLEMLTWEVEDRPAALDLIARIRKAQDHLKHLYDEVRNYAAPLKLEREPWNLALIWRQAWEHLEASRQNRDAVLREETADVDLTCAVDHYRMEQVFRNIFENSLAACADPIVITIHCSLAMLGGHPALRVSLTDNGTGLNAEQQQHIFDPFYTTKTQGTGLGMAITKRIVEAHGGQIAVGPGTNAGAEILMRFPRELP